MIVGKYNINIFIYTYIRVRRTCRLYQLCCSIKKRPFRLTFSLPTDAVSLRFNATILSPAAYTQRDSRAITRGNICHRTGFVRFTNLSWFTFFSYFFSFYSSNRILFRCFSTERPHRRRYLHKILTASVFRTRLLLPRYFARRLNLQNAGRIRLSPDTSRTLNLRYLREAAVMRRVTQPPLDRRFINQYVILVQLQDFFREFFSIKNTVFQSACAQSYFSGQIATLNFTVICIPVLIKCNPTHLVFFFFFFLYTIFN